MTETQSNTYELAGGRPTFERLAREFYARAVQDPVLLPLYPPESLLEAEVHLALFMMQYFGGPRMYNDLRGHPRLRMRHVPFRIGQPERDAWVKNMLEALETLDVPEPAHSEMQEYFERAATFLMNHP